MRHNQNSFMAGILPHQPSFAVVFILAQMTHAEIMVSSNSVGYLRMLAVVPSGSNGSQVISLKVGPGLRVYPSYLQYDCSWPTLKLLETRNGNPGTPEPGPKTRSATRGLPGAFCWKGKSKKRTAGILPRPHLLSGWPKKSPNCRFATKMVFPKSERRLSDLKESAPSAETRPSNPPRKGCPWPLTNSGWLQKQSFRHDPKILRLTSANPQQTLKTNSHLLVPPKSTALFEGRWPF